MSRAHGTRVLILIKKRFVSMLYFRQMMNTFKGHSPVGGAGSIQLTKVSFHS